MLRKSLMLWLTAFLGYAAGQGQADLAKLLDRLDRMEAENRKLQDEIHSLRSEIATLAAGTTTSQDLAARADVQENRTAELAQSKVEASQRMPIALTGMLLFNAFHNGKQSGTSEYPVVASNATGPAVVGATFRQSVIGLTFNGPDLPGGGKASGSVYMDFFPGGVYAGDNTFRLRVATLDLAWRDTTITVGQDKPIIAPREPVSLAQVGVSPLTGAGNLWDWQPQARVQQRIAFNETAGMLVQAGVYQTSEDDISTPAGVPRNIEHVRPGYESRFEFFAGSDNRRIEIAPGFHYSTTHLNGNSIPSRVVSLDWRFKPSSLFEFTGAAFTGQNLANLGALRQGVTVLPSGAIIPVHSQGGWGQFTYFSTPRLTFHLFTGVEADRASDLQTGGISRNLVYGGNLMYRLAPNVIAALEGSHTITSYVNQGTRTNNHYDLAIAYQF
jgi:hypothetical protein